MTEPVIARRSPAATEVEGGKTYYWCACGRSRNQPFCDGSHKGTGFEPVEFEAPRTEIVFLCCCKKSKHAPMCDGTHNKI